MALHASIPAALVAVFLNAIVVNKTYKPAKLLGELVAPPLRTLLRRCYVVVNAVLIVLLLAVLSWKCPPYVPGSIDDAMAQESCLPVQSLTAIVVLIFQWTDRAVLAFLQAPGATEAGFITRLARGAVCVGFLMAVSDQDSIANWFLLVCICNRYSGSVSWAVRLKVVDNLIRFLVILRMCVSLWYSNASRRLSGLCLACVVHSR
jgi:hypothetical protein